jgi:hypothetical protein
MKLFNVFLVLFVLIGCKKKEDCPGPKAGQTIINDVSGEYSGLFETTIQYNHSSNQQDTTITSFLSFFNTPISNSFGSGSLSTIADTVDIADVNGYFAYNYSNYYYVSIDNYMANPSNSCKNIFNNLIYNFSSTKFGTISLNDHQLSGSFTNITSIPLTFSNSNPYTLTLNNLTNCSKITVEINDGVLIASRTVLPSNPNVKFYASEIINTTPGNITTLNISLINSKDTTINGYKFKLKKNIRHSYDLTFTN